MRILLAGPNVAHPFGDTSAKWLYVFMRELLARGHEVVSLVATEEPEARIREAEHLLRQADGRRALTLRWRRLSVDRFALRRKLHSFLRPCSEIAQDREFVAEVRRELARGYDVLHLEHLWAGWLGMGVPRALVNIHHFEIIDWEERIPDNFRERKALWQMRRGTQMILRLVPAMRLFTERLEKKAATINPEARRWVVPFALDLSLYPLQPMGAEPVLGLIGSMHWIPSRSAGERLLTRIWPLVKRRMPQAKLFVAGWNARKYLARYLPQPDVEIQENLAHPTEFFSRVAVMAYAPSRGSGMKIKVLESMAYGVPVVTTWEGVEGIDYRNGEHCWVEEEDEAIAEQAVGLLSDCTARERMRQAARQLVQEKYSPKPVVDRMLAIYEQIARS